MIQLKTNKSTVEGYHEATLIVDTGTSVITIDLGVSHPDDLIAMAYEMADEAATTLKKLGEIPEGF